MARDVKSKLNFYGGGDIDRAVDVAELVLQDPIMVLAVERHNTKHKQRTMHSNPKQQRRQPARIAVARHTTANLNEYCQKHKRVFHCACSVVI